MRPVTTRRLLVLWFVGVVAACSGPAPSPFPSATPGATQLSAAASPSSQPTDTALPSVAPTDTPTSSPGQTEDADPCSNRVYDGPWTVGPLLLGSAVKVSVAELNLRAGPCTAAKRIETLRKGDILIVNPYPFGPLKGNGYPWYMVRKLQLPGADGGLPPLPLPPVELIPGFSHWIAANDGSRPYVTPLPPRCPATVDLANVRGMLPAERLACFNAPFVLQGTFGCGGCGGAGGPISKPLWLAPGWESSNLRSRWDVDESPVSIYFRPKGPAEPAEGSIIRVTVHVDDPAAVNCTIDWTIVDPGFRVPDEIAIPYCRERMVVDSYEILGDDPNYPG